WEIGGIGLVMIILQIWILRRTKTMSQEFDDLRSAIGDLGSAISRETNDINGVLDQLTGNIHPSDLKDLTGKIRASISNINDASAKLEAAVATPAPETPASAPEEAEGGQTTGPGAPEPAPGGEGGQTTGPGAPEPPPTGGGE